MIEATRTEITQERARAIGASVIDVPMSEPEPRPRPTETEEARLRLMSYLPDGARVYHRTTYSQRGSQRYIRFYCVVPTSAGAEKFHGIEDITGLVARVTASRRAPSGANIGAIATRGADAGLLIYNLGYALRGRHDLRALAL